MKSEKRTYDYTCSYIHRYINYTTNWLKNKPNLVGKRKNPRGNGGSTIGQGGALAHP